MKNRDFILAKLEQVEGKLKNLNALLRTGQSVEEFQNTLNTSEDLIQEIKEYIEREPISYN
jgi:cell fate (sporulation/competence/biofilm development) regulator YmcA (YheA/YmcA/DUF963 family)